eukprot:9947122-Ditylum_brightwellii.AAC.1
MKHYVWTGSGESTEYYTHTEDYMKAGEGQGKTLSPPNWLFQSSTLLKSLEEQCTGLHGRSENPEYGYPRDNYGENAKYCANMGGPNLWV